MPGACGTGSADRFCGCKGSRQAAAPTARTALDISDYDIVFIGSGFASGFFLRKRLQTSAPNARFLVLERGPLVQRHDQIADRRNTPVSNINTYRMTSPDGAETNKVWQFNIGFGGSSNC